MDAALTVLKTVFGHAGFRSLQQEIISHACEGGHALVLMPTGGGKSLCYQIPALLRPGLAVVVSPLIALMRDQVDALERRGVRAAFLNSAQDADAAARVRQSVGAGTLDLLYVAPERLMLESMLDWLGRRPLSLIAIDEAHCVSQWGHDFRPDYLRLSRLTELFPTVPRMALTATANPATRRDIRQRLGLEGGREFVTSFDRPNIRYSVQRKSHPPRQLTDFLRCQPSGASGIVYCLSRARTEEVATMLRQRGYDALAYHAGLDTATREAHQAAFLERPGVIIVATVAFGMGIDKPDVRFVFHMDPPKSIEGYYQESGRAGRDGKAAEAMLLLEGADLEKLRWFINQSEAPEAVRAQERHRLEALFGYAEAGGCRRRVLLGYFGEHHPGGCGNCDLCLGLGPGVDATLAARKALSNIHHAGAQVSLDHLVDVLVGQSSGSVLARGHQRLSTYALGREFPRVRWETLHRQLCAAGLAEPSPGQGSGLRLTEACRPLLRGEGAFHMGPSVLESATESRPTAGVTPAPRSTKGRQRRARRKRGNHLNTN
ncbi:MAG: RecQ family ATP-dependent DNA helicase [Magnetococcus sp. WYHC-3]